MRNLTARRLTSRSFFRHVDSFGGLRKRGLGGIQIILTTKDTKITKKDGGKLKSRWRRTTHQLRRVSDQSEAPTKNLDAVQWIFSFVIFVSFVVQIFPIPVTSVNDSSNAVLQHGHAKIDDQTESQPG